MGGQLIKYIQLKFGLFAITVSRYSLLSRSPWAFITLCSYSVANSYSISIRHGGKKYNYVIGILLLCLINVTAFSQANNFTGKWQGTFSNDDNKREIYKIECTIFLRNDSLIGYTNTILPNQEFAGTATLTTVVVNEHTIILKEDKLLAVKNGYNNDNACLMTCTLILTSKHKNVHLKGAYTAKDNSSNFACSIGTITLKKMKE